MKKVFAATLVAVLVAVIPATASAAAPTAASAAGSTNCRGGLLIPCKLPPSGGKSSRGSSPAATSNRRGALPPVAGK
jgi:hypothetical protein